METNLKVNDYIDREIDDIIKFIYILDDLYNTVDTQRNAEKYRNYKNAYLDRLDVLKQIKESGE
jgi:hypothetical protein